jgi:uncharacterized protein with HEPN domain
MQRDPRAFLWDAMAATDAILLFIGNKNLDDDLQDALLRSAVERQFEILRTSIRSGHASRISSIRLPDL